MTTNENDFLDQILFSFAEVTNSSPLTPIDLAPVGSEVINAYRSAHADYAVVDLGKDYNLYLLKHIDGVQLLSELAKLSVKSGMDNFFASTQLLEAITEIEGNEFKLPTTWSELGTYLEGRKELLNQQSVNLAGEAQRGETQVKGNGI